MRTAKEGGREGVLGQRERGSEREREREGKEREKKREATHHHRLPSTSSAAGCAAGLVAKAKGSRRVQRPNTESHLSVPLPACSNGGSFSSGAACQLLRESTGAFSSGDQRSRSQPQAEGVDNVCFQLVSRGMGLSSREVTLTRFTLLKRSRRLPRKKMIEETFLYESACLEFNFIIKSK